MRKLELNSFNEGEVAERREEQAETRRKFRPVKDDKGNGFETRKSGGRSRLESLSSWVPRGNYIDGDSSRAPTIAAHMATSPLHPPPLEELRESRRSEAVSTFLITEADQLHLPPKRRDLILSNKLEILGESNFSKADMATSRDIVHSDFGPKTAGLGSGNLVLDEFKLGSERANSEPAKGSTIKSSW